MTNSKTTKKALLSSVVALLLCFTMLLGTTFAWFTDTASTSVNTIKAGTLDVTLEKQTGPDSWESVEGQTLDFVKAAGHESEAILWEPGCTYNLPTLRVGNNGNLALKYKIVISGINGDTELNEVITWTVDGTELGTEQSLAAGKYSEGFTISGHMSESAGNEYQGKKLEGIAITVYATQDTVEYDSNGNQYDAGAVLPDASVATAEDLAAKLSGEGDVNVILNAGTYTLPQTTNKNVVISGSEDTVIDMTSSAMIGAQNTNLDITFDGVTVNFANEDYKGITHAKKVTYQNCVLNGKQFLYADEVKFVNCTFINSNDYAVWTYGANKVSFEKCTFASGGKAILIYTEDAAHTSNVTVNNCTFYDNGTLNTVKAAIEIGDSQPTAGLKVNLTATNNTIHGFAINDEGTSTGTKMYGNKNSIPAERLNVTASGNVEDDSDAGVVTTGEALNTKLSSGGNAMLVSNVTTGSNATYGTTAVGIKMAAGTTLDGNGHTLSKGDNAGYTILTAGGTIKNVKLNDSARAIFIDKPTADTVLDNVTIAGAGYAINTGSQGNADAKLTVTNSTINGWTSFANIASASFTSCSFGSCDYFKDYSEMYHHYLRPFVTTTFTNCSFDKGFYIDLTKLPAGCTVTLTNCTCNGVTLTKDNFADYVKIIKDVVNKTDVYAVNGDTLTNLIW